MIEKGHHDFTSYAYVYNNPLRFIAPNGLDTLKFDENGKYIETITADGEHVGSVDGVDG